MSLKLANVGLENPEFVVSLPCLMKTFVMVKIDYGEAYIRLSCS